jgi:hypothetical protein
MLTQPVTRSLGVSWISPRSKSPTPATDISFSFTLDGDILATDWGKYMVIMDTAPGGDVAGNGWGRPISMTSGADYWFGSWVDSGNGVELYDYSGAWNKSGTPSIATTQFTVTLSAPLADLGLSIGDTFEFDAFTSGGGGGDGAVDSLGNPNQQMAIGAMPRTPSGLVHRRARAGDSGAAGDGWRGALASASVGSFEPG